MKFIDIITIIVISVIIVTIFGIIVKSNINKDKAIVEVSGIIKEYCYDEKYGILFTEFYYLTIKFEDGRIFRF